MQSLNNLMCCTVTVSLTLSLTLSVKRSNNFCGLKLCFSSDCSTFLPLLLSNYLVICQFVLFAPWTQNAYGFVFFFFPLPLSLSLFLFCSFASFLTAPSMTNCLGMRLQLAFSVFRFVLPRFCFDLFYDQNEIFYLPSTEAQPGRVKKNPNELYICAFCEFR